MSKKKNYSIVIEPYHLQWPEHWSNRDMRYRGGPGTIVDMDNPLEAEWLKGQEHKLEPIEVKGKFKDAVPTEITHPTACAELWKLENLKNPKAKPSDVGSVVEENAKSEAAVASAESVIADAEIPDVDSVAPKSPSPDATGALFGGSK